jgi:hypothetical protein
VKVGDLVRCTWQPGSSRIENGAAVQMKYYIKGEMGMIDKIEPSWGASNPRCSILFPQFGYTHWLCPSAFETINESR